MSLESEFQAVCPCCQSTLIIDANLRRVVGHEDAGGGLDQVAS